MRTDWGIIQMLQLHADGMTATGADTQCTAYLVTVHWRSHSIILGKQTLHSEGLHHACMHIVRHVCVEFFSPSNPLIITTTYTQYPQHTWCVVLGPAREPASITSGTCLQATQSYILRIAPVLKDIGNNVCFCS